MEAASPGRNEEEAEGVTGNPITISVAGLGGPLCTVEATTTWTIRQVQVRIFELIGAPIGRQGLFKGTEKLRPGVVLGDWLDETSPETLGLTLVISQAQWRFGETAPVDFSGGLIEGFGNVGRTWLAISDEGREARNLDHDNGLAELSEELLPEMLPVRLSLEMPYSQDSSHYIYLRHPDHDQLAGVQISVAGRYHVTITKEELHSSRCNCGEEGAHAEGEETRCSLPWSIGSSFLHFGVYLYVVSQASLAPCDTCTWA